MTFCLNEPDRITSSKGLSKTRMRFFADYPDFFSAQDIERLSDSRISRYLFNKMVPVCRVL